MLTGHPAQDRVGHKATTCEHSEVVAQPPLPLPADRESGGNSPVNTLRIFSLQANVTDVTALSERLAVDRCMKV
jgi:hypothetical protein